MPPPLQAYTNLVYARAATIERVLKLVCTEDDMLDETFQLLWPDGTKEDLEAVKNLKGSGNAALDEITGQAQAMASSTGKPKPSYKEGYTSAKAPL